MQKPFVLGCAIILFGCSNEGYSSSHKSSALSHAVDVSNTKVEAKEIVETEMSRAINIHSIVFKECYKFFYIRESIFTITYSVSNSKLFDISSDDNKGILPNDSGGNKENIYTQDIKKSGGKGDYFVFSGDMESVNNYNIVNGQQSYSYSHDVEILSPFVYDNNTEIIVSISIKDNNSKEKIYTAGNFYVKFVENGFSCDIYKYSNSYL